MNFLTPWFWLGTVAIVGPVLFHLLRRSARERMPFSSLMFLSPTPPRAVRRRKFEHLLLLLLRCLCLVLLAAGFASPFFTRDNPPAAPAPPGRQLLLLVDTSASMRREGAWARAMAVAGTYLKETQPMDRVAVMTFDRQPRMLVSFKQWSSWSANERTELARQQLMSVSPGWMGTQLGLALTAAAEQLMDDPAGVPSAGNRELVLITDLQEGARLDGLQGYEWPARTAVIVERVEPKRRGGAGLEIPDESRAGMSGQNGVFARVANDRESDQEKFQLGWVEKDGNAASGSKEIYLPPGQTRSVTLAFPGGPTGELRLTDAETDFGSVSYYVAPENEDVTIAYLGTESANDPAKLRYYLQRAFYSASGRQIELLSPTNVLPLSELLDRAALAVLPAALVPEETQSVRDWLKQGKSALLILTDVQSGPTLAAILGLSEVQLTEATGDYALLGEIDFTHPLFSEFADPRFGDFTRIHFWKHRRWEIPSGVTARVLARFDDGSPALTEIPVDKGNLLVLASGWGPADSQLAVSSKFVPLMQTILDWSGAAQPMRHQFRTGELISSPVTAGSRIRWIKPDGTQKNLAAGAPFAETDQRGIYEATDGVRQWRFAVNVPLEESRTASFSPDELAQLGVPLATLTEISSAPAAEHLRHLQEAELENRQKIWRWLIGSVLVFTFFEVILGGWFTRRIKTVEAGA